MTQEVQLFNFEKAEVRVVIIDGEPWWVAMDVADALGYSDAHKMTSRLDDEEKQNRQIGGFGNRGVTIINEPGIYEAIIGSQKDQAKRFKKWLKTEVLPSIRKTGSYSMQSRTAVVSSKVVGELAVMECFTRLLKPAPSSQMMMLAKISQNNGLDASFLPAYTVDAAANSTDGSSMPTKALTALLREHHIPMSPAAFNRLLESFGYLKQLTRRSSKGDDVSFWSVTERGLNYGKNLTSPNCPRETQPHWYVERFGELATLVLGRRVA